MEQKAIWDNRFSNSTDNPQFNEWVEKYLEYFNEKAGCVVVDLGCGRGANAVYLHNHGFNVLACDFSLPAIKFINENHPAIKTRCFDMIHEFPTDFRDVGVVLASLSTHYFTLEDTTKLYNNIRNMLGLGGYFIFRVNSKKEYAHKNKAYVTDIIEEDYYALKDGVTKRYFDIDSISALLGGFSIIQINENISEYNDGKKYFIEGIVQKI